jgi:hypothetical protein
MSTIGAVFPRMICDLDGTLALDEHRAVHLHPENVRDWDKYYSLCHLDGLNEPVAEILRYFHSDYTIYILSGRIQRTYVETLSWLQRHEVPFHYLQLRGDNDRTQDTELKINWARKDFLLTPENTLFVLEDRQRVVDAWRANGYTCLQVASNQF